jgi:hypothetical protein
MPRKRLLRTSVQCIAVSVLLFVCAGLAAVSWAQNPQNPSNPPGGITPGHVYTPITNNPAYHLVFDDEFGQASFAANNNWQSANSNILGSGQTAGCVGVATAQNTQANNHLIQSTIQQTIGTCPFTGAYIGPGNGSGGTNDGLQINTYAEALIQSCNYLLANCYGAWNAFFLYGDHQPSVEIDMEWLGTNVDLNSHYTYHDYVTSVSNGTTCNAITQGYHVYGIYWTSTTTNLYIDGSLCAAITPDVTATDTVGVWLSALVGFDDDYNQPNSNTTWPNQQTIVYVHVYNTTAPAVSPQPNYGGPGSTAVH